MAFIPKLSATTRIVFSLVSMSTSLLMIAASCGALPDRRADVMEGRVRLCESLALNFSIMARNYNVATLNQCFSAIADRNPQMLSLGIRRPDGKLLFQVADHSAHWTLPRGAISTETHVAVPVYAGNRPWGTLEVSFQPIHQAGMLGWLTRPEFKLASFMTLASLTVFYLYLRRVLRQLNPSKVIPTRVREAFDSLAEGLVVLDKNEHIVLANRAFELAVKRDVTQLVGRRASEIPCLNQEGEAPELTPWRECISNSQPIKGRLLKLASDINESRTYSVSSAPILDEAGANRGAMVSFEDVSNLERQKEELRVMVEQLHASGEKIRQQNRELEVLATRDPLTGCYNRRSFLEQFDSLWESASRNGQALSAIMVDVDHFKSVNDTFGHSMGDEVLRKVAGLLRDTIRDSGIVCRYGGEEFAILLPFCDLAGAERAAERLREGIERLEFEQLSVTASLGASSLCQSPRDPQELLDQADKSLYVAKQSGRNRVVRWDEVPDQMESVETTHECKEVEQRQDDSSSIPFSAVTALMTAMAYRDHETAAHCRRVADLCIATAEGILPLKDCYVLEIAALLHDIGKIGVPDAILLKPGALNDEEWRIMRGHEQIGVQIVSNSFQCPALSRIVESYRTRFESTRSRRASDGGQPLSIEARILAIAEAYDAMTTSRIYRKGRSSQEALNELKRCAGTQFDPELVERFTQVIHARQVGTTCNVEQVSPEAILSIGTQLERLMQLLNSHDLSEVQALAQRLSSTALKIGISPIASKARELEAYANSEKDYVELIRVANELLDLCRQAQSSTLHSEAVGHG